MFRVEPKLLLTEGATVGWEGGEVGRNGQGREGIGREGGTSRCGAVMVSGGGGLTGDGQGREGKVGRRTGRGEEKLGDGCNVCSVFVIGSVIASSHAESEEWIQKLSDGIDMTS